jgi:hypothetical protein
VWLIERSFPCLTASSIRIVTSEVDWFSRLAYMQCDSRSDALSDSEMAIFKINKYFGVVGLPKHVYYWIHLSMHPEDMLHCTRVLLIPILFWIFIRLPFFSHFMILVISYPIYSVHKCINLHFSLLITLYLLKQIWTTVFFYNIFLDGQNFLKDGMTTKGTYFGSAIFFSVYKIFSRKR